MVSSPLPQLDRRFGTLITDRKKRGLVRWNKTLLENSSFVKEGAVLFVFREDMRDYPVF